MNFNIYAAGFFDGEGSVEARMEKGRGTPFLSTRLAVASNDPRPLLELQNEFGGVLKKVTRPEKGEQWVWRVSGKESEIFAEAIIPHCIVKKEQLQLFLKLRATVREDKRPLAPRVHARRAKLCSEITAHKSRYSVRVRLP